MGWAAYVHTPLYVWEDEGRGAVGVPCLSVYMHKGRMAHGPTRGRGAVHKYRFGQGARLAAYKRLAKAPSRHAGG
jgi:hypothetical protein